MGETLGIAHNVFEKMEREKDRKERMKKYEDWQKEKVRKKQRLRDMRARIREAERANGLAASEAAAAAAASLETPEEDDELDDDDDDELELDFGDSVEEVGGVVLADEGEAEEVARQQAEQDSKKKKKATMGCGTCVVQ